MEEKKTFEQLLNQGAEGDRADYLSVGGADDLTKADNAAIHQSEIVQAQRQANRVFGTPPPSQGDATEARNAGTSD